jgi:hypothetical protein
MALIRKYGLVSGMRFNDNRATCCLLICFLGLSAGLASTGDNSKAYPERIPFVIDRSQFSFGTIFAYGDSRIVYESRYIQRRPGQLYGWRIGGIVGIGAALVRERLTLPSAPETWGEQGDEDGLFLISSDQTTCLWERNMPVVDETIGNHWGFAEGDPRGIYEIQVTLAGVLLDELLFFVD